MRWSISVCFGWASSLHLVDPFPFTQTPLCPLVDGMSYQMASRIDNRYQSFSGKAGSHLLFFLSHLSPRWKCPWSSFNHSLTVSHSPILFAPFRGRIPCRFHLRCPCNPTLQRGLFHLPPIPFKDSIFSWRNATVHSWLGKFKEQCYRCHATIMEVQLPPLCEVQQSKKIMNFCGKEIIIPIDN